MRLGGVEGSGGHDLEVDLTAGVGSLGEKRLVSAVCSDQGGCHLSRLRPNICVVTLERADNSSISDIACSKCSMRRRALGLKELVALFAHWKSTVQ